MARFLRTASPGAILLIAAACILPPARGWGIAAAPEPEADSPASNVYLDEDEAAQNLIARLRRLRGEGRWRQVIELSDRLLARYGEQVYHAGGGIYKPVREYVHQLMASLPPEALDLYRLLNDDAAERLYRRARTRMDTAGFRQVVARYFATRRGDDALYALGVLSAERGRDVQAVAQWERLLRDYPDSDIGRNVVMVRMVRSALRAGRFQRAKALLKELKIEQGDRSLRVAGRPVAIVQVLAAELAAAESARADYDDVPAADWTTFGGNAAHNLTPPSAPNLGIRKWLLKIPGAPSRVSATSNRMNDFAGQDRPLFPVVSNGILYLLTDTHVYALDASDADFDSPRWRFPLPRSDEAHATIVTGRSASAAYRPHPRFVTVGGGRVYAAVGRARRPPPLHRGWGRTNRQEKESTNAIYCFNARSGKLLWTTRDPRPSVDTQTAEFLAQAYFVTSPTYDGERLYVGCIQSKGTDDVYLVCLDAASGALLWKRYVCSGFDRPRRGLVPDLGLPPAAAEGRVYYVTNFGAIAALDAASGRLHWIRTYPRLEADAPRNIRIGRARTAGLSDLWLPNPPIVLGDTLLTTPQDCAEVIALDVTTGKTRWRLARGELRHMLGVLVAPRAASGVPSPGVLAEDLVIFSGPQSVVAVGVHSGKRVWDWRSAFAGDTLLGRGVVTARAIAVPGRRQAYFLGPFGKLLKDRPTRPWARELAGSNLTVAGDVLVATGAAHAAGFYAWETIHAKLTARIAATPQEPHGHFEMAGIYFQKGAYDQAARYYRQCLDLIGRVDRTGLTDNRRRDTETLAFRARKRLFEVFFASGEKAWQENQNRGDKAQAHFQKALAGAVDGRQRVQALLRLGSYHEDLKAWPKAAGFYQSLLERDAEVVFPLSEQLMVQAGVLARQYVQRLIRTHGRERVYAALDRKARQALNAASGRVAEIERLLTQYPNSEVIGEALLALAKQTARQKQYRRAARFYRRYLAWDRALEQPRPDALLPARARAWLELGACREAAGRFGAARRAYEELLTGYERISVRVHPDETREVGYWDEMVRKPGPRASSLMALAEYARRRLLTEEALAQAPTTGRVRLELPLKQEWEHTWDMNQGLLPLEGAPETADRFFVRDGRRGRVEARDGHSGGELWRLKLSNPILGVFAGEQLIVLGAKQLCAVDPITGQEHWRFNLPDGGVSMSGASYQTTVYARNRFLATPAVAAGRVAIPLGRGEKILVLDASTGALLWQVSERDSGPLLSPLVAGEGVLLARRRSQVQVYDLESGARRFPVGLQGVSPRAEPILRAGRLILPTNRQDLEAFDLKTGGSLWRLRPGGVNFMVRAGDAAVYCTSGGRTVKAYDPATGKRKWQSATLDAKNISGLYLDGDLVLATSTTGGWSSVAALDAASGELRWKQRIESRSRLRPPLFTARHVVFLGTNSERRTPNSSVTLIDRKTGKLAQKLEHLGRTATKLAVFDGGVIVSDTRGMIGYGRNVKKLQQAIRVLRERLTANAADHEARLALCAALYEAEQFAACVRTAAGGLRLRLRSLIAGQARDGDGDTYAQLYGFLARARRALSTNANAKANAHIKISVPMLARGQTITVDGDLSEWPAEPTITLGGPENLYLPSPAKPGVWRGPKDLSVQAWLRHDERFFYLALRVTDERHNNPHEGTWMWNGDSVQIAVDPDGDGGDGAYGERDSEFGFALCGRGPPNQKPRVQAIRWVRDGHWVHERLPEQVIVRIARNKWTKTTTYEAAIPWSEMGIDPAKRRSFGFNFAVLDLDLDADGGAAAADSRVSGMALTPGIWLPKSPGSFARVELEAR